MARWAVRGLFVVNVGSGTRQTEFSGRGALHRLVRGLQWLLGTDGEGLQTEASGHEDLACCSLSINKGAERVIPHPTVIAPAVPIPAETRMLSPAPGEA